MSHLINADSLHIPLADQSVHMIATSPPYWSLRDYGVAAQMGGERLPDCLAWAQRDIIGYASKPEFEEDGDGNWVMVGDAPTPMYGPPKPPCNRCYVCALRKAASEMWRVLRDDGTLWLNLGDTYANYDSTNRDRFGTSTLSATAWSMQAATTGRVKVAGGLKRKDLCGLPWRVALALQADGWYLRSDILWSKKNGLPESVTDRPTKAHEYIFLLSKLPRYFYDAEAIREPLKASSIQRVLQPTFDEQNGGDKDYGPDSNRSMRKTLENFAARSVRFGGDKADGYGTRLHSGKDWNPDIHRGANKRTVWRVATAGYPGAHFATWPPDLVEPMIRAGTSERGVCPHCGAPWRRVLEKKPVAHNGTTDSLYEPGSASHRMALARQAYRERGYEYSNQRHTVDWQPACTCPDHAPVPAIVLDPFTGSGTTGVVARQLGRSFIGLDINFSYLAVQARSRLELDKLAAWEQGGMAIQPLPLTDLPLFETVSWQ